MTYILRFLFSALIIFELLNFSGILHFPLDFSWIGLVVTAVFIWVAVEMLAWFFKSRGRLGVMLTLSFFGVSADVLGDVFRLYSKFHWYDSVLHFTGGAISAAVLYLAIERYLQKKGCIKSCAGAAVFIVSNLFGFLYEAEEYFEDLFLRNGFLRFGGWPDTFTDVLMNLMGSGIVILIIMAVNPPDKND